jgi:hypothetical protein
MKVNFKEVQVKDIEGNENARDFSKELGNAIFAETKDLGELELARDIYKNGEVEVSKEQAQVIKGYVQRNFYAWAQEAILSALDAVCNQ